ncbi:MAG TPA: class I SAM-dependent methyltransferase [Phycisphaerae bacterium]
MKLETRTPPRRIFDLNPEPFKQEARRQFEQWAESYDRSLLNHFLFRPAAEAFMEEIARWRLEHSHPLRVLDVGCGTGTLAGLLLRSGWPVEVVGLDYSPNMCRQAAVKARAAGAAQRARFVTGDSEHLPFPDSRFDVITCSNSFHHYPHQQAVVLGMRRLLAPGGRLMIIDGFRDNVIGWVAFDVIIARVEKHVHHAPWTQMRDYFREAGFVNIRQRKINFWMPLLVTTGDGT